MILSALIISELLLIFFLSSRLTNTFYAFFYFIFRSKNIAIGIVTFIYLPGTVIHEFAHLITAEILRVPTGEISFTPKITDENSRQQNIDLGTVQIAQTDPLRRFLIGIAPILLGLGMLMLLTWLWQYFYPGLTVTWQKIALTVLVSYCLFAVSNNMFSSDTDLKDSWALIFLVIIMIAVLYFLGVRIAITGKLLEIITQILNNLSRSLAIVLGVNVIILLINLLALKNFRR